MHKLYFLSFCYFRFLKKLNAWTKAETPDHYTNRDFNDITFYIHRPLTPSCSSFAAIRAFTLLRTLSTKSWNIYLGIVYYSSSRDFLKSGTDVEWESLACNLPNVSISQILPKCVRRGWGQCSVWASHVLSLWSLLCALGHSYTRIEKVHPQTIIVQHVLTYWSSKGPSPILVEPTPLSLLLSEAGNAVLASTILFPI